MRDVLYNLLDFITVIPVDVDILKKELRSNHKDFEDSTQINCASTIEKIDFIVTRNTKDFKDIKIAAYNHDEIILKIENR